MKNIKNILTISLLLAAPAAFGACAMCDAAKEREMQNSNSDMRMSAPMSKSMDSSRTVNSGSMNTRPMNVTPIESRVKPASMKPAQRAEVDRPHMSSDSDYDVDYGYDNDSAFESAASSRIGDTFAY